MTQGAFSQTAPYGWLLGLLALLMATTGACSPPAQPAEPIVRIEARRRTGSWSGDGHWNLFVDAVEGTSHVGFAEEGYVERDLQLTRDDLRRFGLLVEDVDFFELPSPPMEIGGLVPDSGRRSLTIGTANREHEVRLIEPDDDDESARFMRLWTVVESWAERAPQTRGEGGAPLE